MILWHMGLTMFIVWFVMRGNPRVDYRVVMAASLLPDLIDKPIGLIFLKSRYESGRLYGHTLILNVALFFLLFFMRGRLKRRFLLVPLSSLLHVAEDAVWSAPKLFWWPLLGTEFPRQRLTDGTFGFLNPGNNPGALWQEAVGLVVLIFLFVSHGMLSPAGLRRFLSTGMLEPQKKETT